MGDSGQMSREQLLELRKRVQRQLEVLEASGHRTPEVPRLIGELKALLGEIDAELEEGPHDAPTTARATDQVFAHPRSWWDWLEET